MFIDLKSNKIINVGNFNIFSTYGYRTNIINKNADFLIYKDFNQKLVCYFDEFKVLVSDLKL